MRRRKTEAKKKRKKVTVKLLERKHAGRVTTAYRLMESLIREHHEHLKKATIAIAWRFGWNQDADGRCKLGQAKKGSDLDRELHGNDFVILLNHEVWNASSFSESQMQAVLDHELCHCAVSIDSNGEPKIDEQGRTCYRMRKHDIEEFTDVVHRHGLYKADVERFAEAAFERKSHPLLHQERDEAKPEPAEDATSEPVDEVLEVSPDWRGLPIAELRLSASTEVRLMDAGLNTLGQLGDHVDEHGQWWAKSIVGFGEASAEKVSDAFTRFWADHPEFCEKPEGDVDVAEYADEEAVAEDASA